MKPSFASLLGSWVPALLFLAACDRSSIDGPVNNVPPTCGDQLCNGNETCTSCAADCGPCAPGGCGNFPAPPQSGGVTYYVAPTGNDNDPGSETQPFATIQQAADVVNPGDTVIVENGTYTTGPGTMVRIARGGTSLNWVWFKARNVWGAKLAGLNKDNDVGFGLVSGVGFVRVEGFEIYDITVHDGVTTGGSGGIECYSGGHDSELVRNHIHDIGKSCTDTLNGLSAMFIQQPNVVIEGNLIHDIGRYAPNENGCTPGNAYYMNHDHGVYIDGATESAAIPGADGLVLRNNVLYNVTRGWPLQLYPGALTGVHIVNNTFAFANPYRDGHLILDADLTDVVIRNNIFYSPTTTALNVVTTTITNMLVSDNLVSVGSMASATPGGMTVTNNQLSTDPSFVDITNRDFHLTSTSPAVDVGATLSNVGYDYDQCARPVGGIYDIGADEFGAP